MTSPEIIQTPEDTQERIVAVDKFQDSILKAVKAGKCSLDDVFKTSRQVLGYSRRGPRIRISLTEALERVVQKGFLRVEDDEAFFTNDDARIAHYEARIIVTPVPTSYARPRRRRYRRYRRW